MAPPAVPVPDDARGDAPGAARAWLWPLAITLGLALVIAVNAAFIVIAVTGADEVVESYRVEER